MRSSNCSAVRPHPGLGASRVISLLKSSQASFGSSGHSRSTQASIQEVMLFPYCRRSHRPTPDTGCKATMMKEPVGGMDKVWHFDGIVNHYEIRLDDVMLDLNAGHLIGLLSIKSLLLLGISGCL